MVITALTRNQVYRQRYRGFESHPLRQKKAHPSGWAFFWHYDPGAGGIRKAALGGMPVACRNRRGFSAEKGSHPLRQLIANYAGSRRLFFMLRMKKSSLTCSTAPRFKIVTALLAHDFAFAAGTGRDVHEKSPSGWMGFFGAAARVGEDGAEIRRRSVYTDAAFWSRKSWMTSNRWTGSSCWAVQSRARRSTAARSSEKGEMTASVVQQPLCRCWPRSP